MHPSTTETKLDAEINTLLDQLKNSDKTSEEYGRIVDRLAKLHKLKAEERTLVIEPDDQFQLPFGLKPPSLDTVMTTAVYLFGIIWITRYEKENVLSTKTTSFFPRLK